MNPSTLVLSSFMSTLLPFDAPTIHDFIPVSEAPGLGFERKIAKLKRLGPSALG